MLPHICVSIPLYLWLHTIIYTCSSQGFQLVVNPSSRGQGEDSLFSLHTALLRLKEDIEGPRGRRRTHNHIVVKMSLGRVFQKVELTHPDMVISIYKAK